MIAYVSLSYDICAASEYRNTSRRFLCRVYRKEVDIYFTSTFPCRYSRQLFFWFRRVRVGVARIAAWVALMRSYKATEMNAKRVFSLLLAEFPDVYSSPSEGIYPSFRVGDCEGNHSLAVRGFSPSALTCLGVSPTRG